MRLADPDLWGYLTYGRMFVEQGRLSDRDVFAYTSTGSHWVTFEYLAHVLLWVAYREWGSVGLIALKCLLGGLAMYWMFSALRVSSSSARIWLPVFAFSASTVSRFFLFRPQLFTFAFFAYFVAVLFRYLQRGDGRLWTLPFVMVIWANAHGGFLAGLGAIGLAILLRASRDASDSGFELGAAMRGVRALVATLVACVAVTFINPQGPRLWLYVLTEMTHGTNRRYIAEWAPASLTSGDVWSSMALTILGALIVLSGWAASRRGGVPIGPRPVFWVASCLPTVALAWLSVRHVPIAVIWAAPIVAMLAEAGAPTVPTLLRRAWMTFSTGAVATIYLALIVVWVQPRPTITEDGNVLGRTHPCTAVAFLRANHIAGNVFTPLWWGSYVTWNLYPDVRVSMDGRNISLFPDAMVTENLRFYTDDPESVDLQTPVRHDSDFLLVPRDTPALPRIERDTRWLRIYADNDSIVFVRADDRYRELVGAVGSGALVSASPPCPPTLE